ncbi:hypothetical protein JTB14_025496 [Gonioctena quinquepunctata]|nr:hypothetical protein JTB14_025496 [Gonioctena quinquepunctata]
MLLKEVVPEWNLMSITLDIEEAAILTLIELFPDAKIHGSLEHLPVENVDDGWLVIKVETPNNNEELTKFYDYFVTQWLEHSSITKEMWNCYGKGRLYAAYSLSGSEGEDSPRRYNSQHAYQHPLYQQPAGLSDTPTSENASDATLTDSELALARDSTLLVHNGVLLPPEQNSFSNSIYRAAKPAISSLSKYRFDGKDNHRERLAQSKQRNEKYLILEFNLVKLPGIPHRLSSFYPRCCVFDDGKKET